MQICFTGSAQPVICCETVRRQKQNCTKSYSPLLASGCSRLLASDRKCGTLQFLGLQAHSEIVTVETQFVPPSEFTGLMKENGLIRCLRNHVKPRSVVFLNPTLSGYLVPWDVFYIRGMRIHSIVRRLIIVVTVITVPGRAGSCSLVKPLRTRHAGWRRRRLRYVDWPFSGCLPLFGLLRSLSPRRWSLRWTWRIRWRSWLL